MKKPKKILKYAAIIFAFVIVAAVGTAEFTSRPNFCNSCHYMEPFYGSWKSSVHSKITCTKCHFPPGLEGTVRGKLEGLVQVVNYVSGSFARRRPWAEISDASCLQSGCHATKLLNKDVLFKGVHFNHTVHLTKMTREKKLRCTSCHSQIIQGEHIVVSENTCFLCHLNEAPKIAPKEYKKLSNCSQCHQWNKFSKEEMKKFRFDHSDVVKKDIACKHCHSNVIVGDGAVPRENCYSCHFDNERIDQYKNTPKIHKTHILENKVECERCHLTIQHKISKINPNSKLACSSCHSNAHEEQLTLFTGKDVDGIKGIPNPMFLKGLHCESCHIFHKQLFNASSVNYASSKSCESCHGKGYANLLKLWKKTAGVELKKYVRNLNSLKLFLKSATKRQKVKSAYNLKYAEEIYNLINRGKAIHNINYSNELIFRGDSLINNALQMLGKPINNNSSSRSIVPNECSNCHTGIENLTVKYKEFNYSHKTHLVDNKLQCKECHSNEVTHGQLVFKKEKCSSCHHSEKNYEKCESCHNNEQAVYTGTIFNLNFPDPMFEEEVSCTDCHIPDNKVIKPKANVCESCHDDDYVEEAKNWISEFNFKISSISKKIAALKRNSKKINILDVSKQESKFNILRFNSGKSIHNHDLVMKQLNKISIELEQLEIGDTETE